MPIRTRRGRISAYRAVWEWPLHSPARLVAVVAVVAGVAVALSLLLGGTGGPSMPGSRVATPGALPRATVGAAVPAPTAPPELTPRTLPVSAAPPAALTVARAWTTAWADHPPGVTAARWSAGLAPFTTAEYLPVLASVDPANVPGTRVTGAAQAVEVRPESLRVQVPTDAVRLELLLVQVAPGDWRVAGYDRAG